jgi:hypothetical protein
MRMNFLVFKMAAWLNLYPVKFTRVADNSGRIRMETQTSLRRIYVFILWVTFILCHLTHILGETIMSAILAKTHQLEIQLLMIIACQAFTTLVIIIQVLFVENPSLSCKLFNEMLQLRGNVKCSDGGLAFKKSMKPMIFEKTSRGYSSKYA